MPRSATDEKTISVASRPPSDETLANAAMNSVMPYVRQITLGGVSGWFVQCKLLICFSFASCIECEMIYVCV